MIIKTLVFLQMCMAFYLWKVSLIGKDFWKNEYFRKKLEGKGK